MQVHVSGAKIPPEERTNSFSMKFVKEFIFLKKGKNQLKLLLEMCIVQHAQTKNMFTY